MLRGGFKESLYHRFYHFPLQIRPLRERIDDLPDIVRDIIDNLCEKGFVKKKQISSDAIELFKSYYWPGNLRELESVILRSCIFSEEEIVTRDDIVFTVTENNAGEVKERISVSSSMSEATETTFEQLLEGLAHEVKNPLVAIKTFTQLLSQRFDDAEFRKQFYQIVGRSIDRIEWLTRRVLDYTDFLKAHIIPVNFFTLLEHTIIEHQEKLREKGIVVQREVLKSALSSTVLSDPRQISYVLENILVHCVNDLPEGSQVIFSAKVSHLNEDEKKNFPLKNFLDHRIMELRISSPLFSSLSPGDVTFSLVNPHFYSLELFLSQVIINRNLGIMEKMGEQGASVITIKLPMSNLLEND
jgi:NADH:ubiquinone oxidoreductase subunit